MLTRLLLFGAVWLCPLFLAAQTLPHPILFCTQVPNPYGFGSSMETFGNHQASMYAAPRGGDLYIRYTDGTLKNLTQAAGYGNAGMQLANSIAVRDPHVHWSGTKALFSMVVGAPTQQYQVATFKWKLYEITGLGQNETPVITLVPNQPTGYNNIQPIYGTDDRIIFTSDRPRGGYAHLYPQHDEYESSPIVSGVWKLDPKACSEAEALEMLTHSPSGDFTPIIDHWGRVVFTRWDHLQRDQQADADIQSNTGYGTFNYASEAANAAKSPILPEIEVFPEPRGSRTDLLALPEWANTNGQTFNIFNPWMVNEDGTEIEMLNHIGRHETGGNYFEENFNNDPNLHYFYADLAPTDNPIRSMFHIHESPTTPGLYFGTEAPEFGTHASGMIISVHAPKGEHPEDVEFNYITHPATRSASNNPSPNHSGLYRDPLPISNGQVVVSHSISTREDQNIGSTAMPKSRYKYRLRLLVPAGNYFKADTVNNLTGAGITKSVSWWTPDVQASFNGLMWETYPVEVRPRTRPDTTTLHVETVPEIEQALFDSAGVDLKAFKKFLRRQNMAMLVTRDVTSRDDADEQQPFNLKVWGSTHQTVNPDHPTPLYTVKYLQYVQADQLRGIGGINNPRAGRRPIPQFLHDSLSTIYNLPTTGAQGSANIHPDGSVAALVPAGRALAWQLTDSTNRGIVRERLWVSAVAGEVRVCTSCHGESTLNQAGLTSPTNPPQAMTALLNHIKVFDRDSDGTPDIYDAYPHDPARHVAEPVNETFVANLANWVNQNPDNDNITWAAKTNIPCGGISAVINNRTANNTGKIDRLRRFVDLVNMDEAKLTFDVAYARHSATKFDRLRLRIVTCGGAEEIVYDKAGTELATAPDQTTTFTPSGCSQWRTECVNLAAYAGQKIELVFENIGGWGNRLFLDNVKIREEDPDVSVPEFSGENTPCANATEPYTLTSAHPPGTPILWSITGGTLLSGQGTTTVSVKWGTGSTGAVSVRVGQNCLATTTKNMALTPAPVAAIAANPASGLPTCTEGVLLSATDGPDLDFQWFKDGTAIPGATENELETSDGGVYKVVVENTATTCAAESQFTVFTNHACNPAFCASSGNSASEWIQAFGVAGTTNTSGNDGGYGNFLNTVAPIVLPKGTAQAYTFTPGYAGTDYTERWRVWVDFNKDGDFNDAGEQLFSLSGKNTLTKNYTIPNTRPSGVTRMRVSMRRTAYAASCGTFTQGEVEDYVVIVGGLGSFTSLPPAFKTVGSEPSDLTIFPNPASESVTLAFSPASKTDDVEIVNALGQRLALLHRKVGSTELKLDVSAWAPGIYFAKVGELTVGRFAVQR
ncbi:MAG: GEVED domain-containing protein [Saprospiraceae bacterium]